MRPAMLALALGLMQGCVYAHQTALTPAVVQEGKAETAEAAGCTFFFLNALPIADKKKIGKSGAVETHKLIEQAAGGRPLAGITVDNYSRYWILGTQTCTRVHGTVLQPATE